MDAVWLPSPASKALCNSRSDKISDHHLAARLRVTENFDILAPGDSIENDWRLPWVITVRRAVNVSPSALASI